MEQAQRAELTAGIHRRAAASLQSSTGETTP